MEQKVTNEQMQDFLDQLEQVDAADATLVPETEVVAAVQTDEDTGAQDQELVEDAVVA